MTTPAWATTLQKQINSLITNAEADGKMLVLSNQNLIQTITPPPSTKPFVYGHFVFPTSGQLPVADGTSTAGALPVTNQTHIDSALGGYCVKNVVGIVLRYPWRSMETGSTPGNYANILNSLEAYCTWASTKSIPQSTGGNRNPLIILLIEQRNYGSGGALNEPAYMDTLTYKNSAGHTYGPYEQSTANSSGGNAGNSMIRYLGYVVRQYNALTAAIAGQFDDPTGGTSFTTPSGGTAFTHSLFQGIATQETADGFAGSANITDINGNNPVPPATAFDYSWQKYRDAYGSPNSFPTGGDDGSGPGPNTGSAASGMLYAASNAFASSWIFWMSNFITGQNAAMGLTSSMTAGNGKSIAELFSAYPINNILQGGPDLLPEDGSLGGTHPPSTGTSIYNQVPTIRTLGPGYGDGGNNTKIFYDFSAPEYGNDTTHVTVHSTLTATNGAAIPGITSLPSTGATPTLTINTTSAQSATNPYPVGCTIELVDTKGKAQQAGVTAVGGAGTGGSPYTATLSGGPFTPSSGAVWAGGTAAYYWTIQETYNFAKNTTSVVHNNVGLKSNIMWWYPSSGQAYSWNPDGIAFIAANQYIVKP